MPLSLFHHDRLAHYQSTAAQSSYDHTFGGSPEAYGLRFINVDQPLHLIYRLNQSDPAVPNLIDGLHYLPLVYGFRYANHDGRLLYRVHNEVEIEVLSPNEMIFDEDSPYPGHPDHFPSEPVAFKQMPYNPHLAEDALSLQGIFGLDRLSQSEMERATVIGLSSRSYVDFDRNNTMFSDWTDEDIVRHVGCAPFAQGAPSKSCDNLDCTAEIAYRTVDMEITLPPDAAKLLGQATMKIEGRDVRVKTMRVIAMHQSEPGEQSLWDDHYVQLIFEICDTCHCIRVSNQCT